MKTLNLYRSTSKFADYVDVFDIGELSDATVMFMDPYDGSDDVPVEDFTIADGKISIKVSNETVKTCKSDSFFLIVIGLNGGYVRNPLNIQVFVK
jgi:hypothetical protein